MLKMYHARRAAADSPDFWDENWEKSQLSAVLGDPLVCENAPLFPLFQEKLIRDRLFLEGGCGQAQWVKYFSDRGQRSVGIDFAARTVEAVKRYAANLDVRVGDILALPFEDGAVHTYYSGGVVEHFEGGPEPALAEARRVIAKDGWFLCSVPDLSLLRGWLYREPDLAVRRVARTIEEPPPDGMQFFQYVFDEGEFRARLEAAGFTIERTFSAGMIWGLMEIPGVAPILDTAVTLKRRLRPRPRADDDGGAPAPSSATVGARPTPGLLRRAFVREDPLIPLLGPALRFVRERCANMRMYVAQPR